MGGFRIVCAVLVSLLAVSALAQESSDDDRILVHYDFEDDSIETGPYTLGVYEGAKGSVALSSAFRYGGYRSVEIRDRAGDGAFAELQGYFDDQWDGFLYVSFALLVAEPKETLNVALAGVSHFTMREHGLAVWLKSERGTLYQVTGGADEPLFELEPFVWYVFDIVYHVDDGVYDLSVRAEGIDEPVITLARQTNVIGLPGSSVRKFSFIGDLPGRDGSNAWFYVDDLVIASDRPVSEAPFVAPGRRMLFIDLYDLYRRRMMKRPGCVPALGYEDFGLSAVDVSEAGSGTLDALLAGDDVDVPSTASPFVRERVEAMREWRLGCEGRRALERFRRARELVPDAPIYPMCEVLALAAAGRFREADELFLDLYSSWYDDPRFPAIAASIGLARGELDEAEQWLRAGVALDPEQLRHVSVRRLFSGDIDPGLARALEGAFPDEWRELVRTALTAELRYYVLLWQRRYADARRYARGIVSRFEHMGLRPARWLEREGDTFFYEGAYVDARASYEAALAVAKKPDSLFLRLSDTHFELGELELERHYRERIYGSLRPE